MDYYIVVHGLTSTATLEPMIRLASETDSTFEPYTGETTEISFPAAAGTVYGGELTIYEGGTGKLVSTMAEIASYNGETLPGAWISDRDVYNPEDTPTTGAQVVYELAEPVTYYLSEAEVNAVLTSLKGTNNIWADTGDILYVKYRSK